jgi:hypothetical protein
MQQALEYAEMCDVLSAQAARAQEVRARLFQVVLNGGG